MLKLRKQYQKNEAGELVRRNGQPVPRDVIEGMILPERHHFGTRYVEGAMGEGWLSMGRGKITLHTTNHGDVTYRIERVPGFYCCHCEQKLEAGDAVARAHVADCAKGATSPDKNNPSGYCRINYYDAVKEV